MIASFKAPTSNSPDFLDWHLCSDGDFSIKTALKLIDQTTLNQNPIYVCKALKLVRISSMLMKMICS